MDRARLASGQARLASGQGMRAASRPFSNPEGPEGITMWDIYGKGIEMERPSIQKFESE